jgi:hypothetical protein
MHDYEELKKQVAHFEKVLALGEHDLAYKSYMSFVKIVQQQVEFLNDFNLKSNIDGKKADTAVYERAEGLWSNLPKMITSLNNLRAELKIDYDPNEGKPRRGAISPQTIMNY